MNDWTAVPIGTDGYRIDGDGLCGIAFVPHDMDLARSAARAALIAAAPKLLKACERIDRRRRANRPITMGDLDYVRAAIAAAKPLAKGGGLSCLSD